VSDWAFLNTTIYGAELTRRGFLKAGGALVVYASVAPRDAWAQATGSRNSLDPARLSSWIEIRSDNTVQFRTGKCDFGQSSIYIAYPQIVAEELGMPLEAITDVISGDTDRTPDGGGTFGLLRTNVVNLRKVAAYTREAILELAAQRFGVPREQLTAKDGVVSAGSQSLTYGRLVQGQDLKLVIPVRGNPTDFSGLVVDGNPPLKPASAYTIVGKPLKNPNVVAKVSGKDVWASDVTLPGMWHGRVVHPPTLGSTLVKAGTLDNTRFRDARVIVQRNFLGVVAPSEWDAIQAAKEVAASTEWTLWKGLPGHEKLFDYLRQKVDWTNLPVMTGAANKGDVVVALGGAAKIHSASYEIPYLKHAPIGPAVALADVRDDGTVTVHTNTQNPQFLRKGIATMLNLSIDRVVVRTYTGSGHYGRSNGGNAGAEDQAVLLSKAAGRPIRLQWMRPEDVQWSTQSSAMYSTIRIGLDSNGRVVGYRGDHFGPPMQDDRLLGALLAGLPTMGAPALKAPAPHQAELLVRDPWVYHNVPNVAEVGHGTPQIGQLESPLQVGLRDHSMRTPIQFQQNFPRELAMSEAAALAGIDALQFRIDQTSEPRIKDILARLRDASEWQSRPSPSPDAASSGDRIVQGRGASVIFRDNGFWACAAHVAVTPSVGAVKVERVTLVVDPGIVVNPLQLKRQVEAGCLMGVSIALHEEVPFDEGAVTASDWISYPILKMAEMPEIRVVLVHRPEAGVHGQGSETSNALAASAIASAVFDATGKPVRRLPLRPDLVKRALSA
jgi:CO/xanthine dehydrogenase Mo-binding subunit